MRCVRGKLTLLIYTAFLFAQSYAQCPPEIGQPADLNQFAGKWFFVAGTPVLGKSLSRCGQFLVMKTSDNTFSVKYTAISHRDNAPVTFNVEGRVGAGIVGNWQLQGSNRILGPFRHIIVAADYATALAMVVCTDNDSSFLPRQKFSMIWSRERSPPWKTLERLKSKLARYIDQGEILTVNHGDC